MNINWKKPITVYCEHEEVIVDTVGEDKTGYNSRYFKGVARKCKTYPNGLESYLWKKADFVLYEGT